MRAPLHVVCLAAMCMAMALARGVAQTGTSAPLPNAETFYQEVRVNMARSQREQNRYAYKERRTDIHTNPFGRLGTGGTRVLEIIPTPGGLTGTRRLIERDDKRVTGSEPETFNLPRRDPTGSRNVDDIVRTLDFSILRREVIAGDSFVVVGFAPRSDAKPSTRQGRYAKAFKGTMWVNEDVREVERLEATAIEDMSIGLGFVARIREGATVSAERKPVEGGVWMPTSLRFSGTGRAILFRKLDVDFALDWFDYRLVGKGQ